MSSRAVVLERFGEPLVVREFPVPAAPEGGLVVACDFGGVCGTDLHLQQGHLAIPTPLILGHEGLGRVAELGAGTQHDVNGTPLSVGDAVMWASSISCGSCVPCRVYREPTLCGNRKTYGVNRPTTEEPALSGSWAETIVLRKGTSVVTLPQGVDPLAAMALACAGPTLVHALHERRPIRLGETVVVQGSGPVGLAAAALAQLAGAATVTLLGGPAARLELAAAVGIGDRHVNLVESDDQAAILAGLGGADLVIECTGVPHAVAQGLYLPRRGGDYLVVGQYTDAGPVAVNPHQIVYRQLKVIGSWGFTGAHLAEYVRLLPALTRRFDLTRLVSTYPLADNMAALDAVATGEVMKTVLATSEAPTPT
jgi:threonine dehydrogenase-like Zn-dependent dehydrogenase